MGYTCQIKRPFLLQVQQSLEARAATLVGPPPTFVGPGTTCMSDCLTVSSVAASANK